MLGRIGDLLRVLSQSGLHSSAFGVCSPKASQAAGLWQETRGFALRPGASNTQLASDQFFRKATCRPRDTRSLAGRSRVERWRGRIGQAYLLPVFSSADRARHGLTEFQRRGLAHGCKGAAFWLKGN
jgi:hypothetical protein